MKISIGSKIVHGPWGGGNLFAINLSNYLKSKGHNVIYNLKENDIDIILLTDPRKSSESSSFTHNEIKKYLKNVKKDALVVHRINECDERKGTKGLNKKYIKINKLISDHTVFVSEWLLNIYVSAGYNKDNSSVILAGADKKIFNNKNSKVFNNNEKFKIVTHHWSNNWNKGFEVYEYLDNLINNPKIYQDFQFTFIGNLPKKFKFINSKHIDPVDGIELAELLKDHHAYITASKNEPSGNHHIEAAQCGLPVLYIESGGMPEYCINYGTPFTIENLIEKLYEVKNNYVTHKHKVESYKYNSDDMSEKFLNLFESMMQNKESLIKKRQK